MFIGAETEDNDRTSFLGEIKLIRLKQYEWGGKRMAKYDEEPLLANNSAARYVGLRGDRKVARSIRNFSSFPIPELGKIYLLNEMPEAGRAGGIGKPTRMICRPVGYIGSHGCCLRVEVFRTPWTQNFSTFQVTDFQLGLVRIQELTTYVYTEGTRDGYSWADLSIDDPAEDIKKLFKN